MTKSLFIRCALFGVVLPLAVPLAAQDNTSASTHVETTIPADLTQRLQALCRLDEISSAELTGLGELTDTAPIQRGARTVGQRYHLQQLDNLFELSVLSAAERGLRMSLITRTPDGSPLVRIDVDGQCAINTIRLVDYGVVADSGRRHPLLIRSGAVGDQPTVDVDWLNPPLVFNTAVDVATSAVRVAMVDSGVNYLLPEIRDRLARDANGELVGFDFWDQDALPFDANVVGGGFFVQRHGTRTASIVLREAPSVTLVPYRYPRPDMSRMRALVEHAAANEVAIVGMPLGSDKLSDWTVFQEAAQAHPDLLFIVSAGNNGRNIEQQPVYPAALDISNILVVSSADDFVRPAERTNWGRLSVDFLLPAENRPALDFDGSETRVSGSSYAVSRLVALAARLKQKHPDWQARELIKALQNRYTDGVAKRWVYSGYIANPLVLDDLSISINPVTSFTLPAKSTGAANPANTASAEATLSLPLDVLLLDPGWTEVRVQQLLIEAFEVLAQCGLEVEIMNVLRMDEGPDYLRDLATGTARTVMDAVRTPRVTLVFARDTRMQQPFTGEAFGRGNTRDRPWLTNSVWLTVDVQDPALALAHELVHVLANNGEHVTQADNLMQRRTSPGQHHLDQQQCRSVRDNALEFELVKVADR